MFSNYSFVASANRRRVTSGGSAIDPQYRDIYATFTEPSIPSVSVNDYYTTFGNKVFRITGPGMTGRGPEGFSHYYVDRSPSNLNNTFVAISNQYAAWYFLPITVTGSAGSETISSGTPVEIPFGGGGQPSSIGVGFWDSSVADRYWVSDGYKLWRIAPSTLTWTLVRDFTSDLPDMSAFVAGACGWTGGQLFLAGVSSTLAVFDLRQASKLSFGTLIYNHVTNTIVRYDVGTRITNRVPEPGGTTPGYNGVGVNKAFTKILQQEAGTPCITSGTESHQYVLPISASVPTFGGVENPAYSATNIDQANHGALLTDALINTVGFGTLNSSAWSLGFSALFEFRHYDFSTNPVPSGFAQRIPFAFPQNLIDGIHLSCNTLGSDKYVVMSTYQTLAGSGRKNNELAHELIAFDTTATATQVGANGPMTGHNVIRLGHHFSYPYAVGTSGGQYYAQPHASTSFDGKLAFFGSTMGNNDNYDLYVMILPLEVRP